MRGKVMQKKKRLWDENGELSCLGGLVIWVVAWIVTFILGELGTFALTGNFLSDARSIVGLGFVAFFVGWFVASAASDAISKPSHGLSKCPGCEKEVKGGKTSRFCVGCGVDLDPQCDRCNIRLKEVGSAFCYQCGNPITRPKPTMVLQKSQGESSRSVKPITVDMILTNCFVCGSKRNTQDAYCGICGNLFACASTDQTM
jgi:hypothetical protein